MRFSLSRLPQMSYPCPLTEEHVWGSPHFSSTDPRGETRKFPLEFGPTPSSMAKASHTWAVPEPQLWWNSLLGAVLVPAWDPVEVRFVLCQVSRVVKSVHATIWLFRVILVHATLAWDVCVRVCVFLYIYICIYHSIYIYTYICICTCINVCVYTHTP